MSQIQQVHQVQKIFAGCLEWHGSPWEIKRVIHFGSDALAHKCNWWVGNRCALIYYKNTDTGERNLENYALRNIFFAKIICQLRIMNKLKKYCY